MNATACPRCGRRIYGRRHCGPCAARLYDEWREAQAGGGRPQTTDRRRSGPTGAARARRAQRRRGGDPFGVRLNIPLAWAAEGGDSCPPNKTRGSAAQGGES